MKVTIDLPTPVVDRLKYEQQVRTKQDGAFCSMGRILSDLVNKFTTPVDPAKIAGLTKKVRKKKQQRKSTNNSLGSLSYREPEAVPSSY